MARSGLLTTRRVGDLARAQVPGHWGDGGGLTLQISRWGTASWTFRYRVDGRLREAGIGSLDTLSLEQARKRARLMREQRLDGADPIEHRRQMRAADRRAVARIKTFREAAEEYVELHRSTWRNAKHASQWSRTLEQYAYPTLAAVPLADIDTPMVLRVLTPIWSSRPETASRVRGRIEAVLDAAKVGGFREGENPARLRGHLDKLLPKLSRTKAAAREGRGRGEHHPALPHPELPAFWQQLLQRHNMAAAALRFLILTAARTKETRLAQWREIDLDAGTWTKPANHTKAGREHRVPLSPAAVDVLREMQRLQGDDPKPAAHVFPGRGGSPLSPNAIGAFLQDMRPGATVHGMRSTFSTWAADRRFDHNVTETALAHEIGTAVSRAYQHSDLFDLRRQLADEWARYCTTPPAEPPAAAIDVVVPLRGRA